MAKEAFENEYPRGEQYDKFLIAGYLQDCYLEDNQLIYFKNFDDRIVYFKKKAQKYNKILSNTEIINLYMQFIYSTLEYYIMPLVNIGLEIKEKFPGWNFGKDVVSELDNCKRRYYKRTYGGFNVEGLSDKHKLIVSAMKDYGMMGILKNLNEEILDEIEKCLNVRYSTIDVLRAINYLAQNSNEYKSFYLAIKKKYMI